MKLRTFPVVTAIAAVLACTAPAKDGPRPASPSARDKDQDCISYPCDRAKEPAATPLLANV